MRALYFEGPRQVAIRELAEPEGEVIRGLASAISQGTELLLYRGEGPTPFDPSTGTSGYPCRYGYSWVGRRPDGQRVFAFAPHGDAHGAPLLGRPIRDDIPAARATLAANMETAVTITWDAEPVLGERAVVIGGGVVGCLTAWLLVRAGMQVALIDRRSKRRAVAEALGARASVGPADLVVEATGDPAALDSAIEIAAPHARIVVASFYGNRRAPIDLGNAFHRRRLTLVSSQVSSIPPRLSARWHVDRRFGLVEELLGEPKLDLLIAPPVPFESAADLYASLDREDDVLPCHVFEYD
jgi:threonine dehydrogenase-like Zn-dependent dehydrogenase